VKDGIAHLEPLAVGLLEIIVQEFDFGDQCIKETIPVGQRERVAIIEF
jgi:hypothetical protein